MPRKTVDVQFVKDVVNKSLSMPNLSDADRRSLAYVLERVLHETNNYKGFSYLDGYEAVQAGNYNDTKRRYN